MDDVTLIGDTKVAILIPSRFGDLTLISTHSRDQAIQDTRRFLTETFGGTSQIQAEVENLIGSYNDNGNVVVERVQRVYCVVSNQSLENKDKWDTIKEQARKLCKDLNQCCIGLEWGNNLFFIRGESQNNVVSMPFNKLEYGYQTQFAFIAFRQIRKVDDLRQLLAYDQWIIDKQPSSPNNSNDPVVIATKGKRRSWIINGHINKNSMNVFKRTIRNEDLIFSQSNDGNIQVWLVDKRELRGPRNISVVGKDGVVKRASLDLIMSILNATDSEPLRDVIDKKSLTSKFFIEYSALRISIAEGYMDKGLSEKKALLESQRLLGRIMVLRFLEKKKVFNGDKNYLDNLFDCRERFYHEELNTIFFDILDTPEEDRLVNSGLPYLNGGLFERNEVSTIILSDDVFDKRIRGSIFNTFNKYDFTLDPSADSNYETAIDPSMFGLVLESLCDSSKRKEKGVHYTPPEIALFMAKQGIGRVIAERLKKDMIFVSSLFGESKSIITEDEAEKILECLEDIKILDPAVGSGSLLIACLETLVDISQRCHRILGNEKKRGTKVWSIQLRDFVRNSLYGVDIDEEAVEITKLRLWLSLVVEDDKTPRPLPDLTRNICTGDSLSPIRLNKSDMINPYERNLEFSDLEKASNHMSEVSQRYKVATGKLVRELRSELNLAERDLARIMNETFSTQSPNIKLSETSSFRWDVRFHDVFIKHKNKGFDLVIANPPYVRIQNLDKLTKQDYKIRFTTLAKNSFDLYYAFIEQSLELAGTSGIISFITPNFSKTQSARSLRDFLKDRGAIELWLDFDDKKVFEASVYVSIFLATSSKRSRKTFKTKCLPPLSHCDFDDANCFDSFVEGTANYVDDWGHITHSKSNSSSNKSSPKNNEIHISAPSIWRIGTNSELKNAMNLEKGAIPLGSICNINIGFQTSADNVFIITHIEDISDDLILAKSNRSDNTIEIEKNCLMKIAKEFKPYTIKSESLRCIWPYDSKNQLLPENDFKNEYPLAYSYLLHNHKELYDREKGKHKNRWWGFRSTQGVDCSRSSNKIVLPALMSPAMAAIDMLGSYSYTGSGARGGGAWGIVLRDKVEHVHLRWILAWMNSKTIWEWMVTEGEMLRGGWRGVDRTFLRRLPIRIPDMKVQLEVSKLTEEIESSNTERKLSLHQQIDEIIHNTL
jgi:hypothetical protein